MSTPVAAASIALQIAEFRFGRAVVRPSQRDLLIDGTPVKLGARAFDLVLLLIEHRDRVLGKNELLERVWPGMIVEENNLQVHISALRKLLGPQAIATIPGRGYRFTAVLDGNPSVAQSAAPTEPTQRDATSAWAVSGTAPPSAPALSNLPNAPSALIGREADIAALSALVAAHRIVTVVGAGGLGKTRLAQAVAHTLRHAYTEGVWWVELAPVSDPALLPAAVAMALGVTLSGNTAPLDGIVSALHRLTVLLVLDNCEHVIEAASEFAQRICDHAPGVSVLSTSQERLKVGGEHLYRLAPLALPDDGAAITGPPVAAVALFVERVRSLNAEFALSQHNLSDTIDICRQLDGLPLAIELAAARVPLLGVTGVRERLSERFRILTDGARSAPQRQHTLRDTLDWSHGLLNAQERAVFRRAGVFVGGFTLEAAQHALTDSHIDQWAVLDHLGALVDKSLLVADTSEPPRYQLLQTARAYALEKSRESGEFDAMRERHARAVLEIFEALYTQMWTMTLDARFEIGVIEIDNVRAALAWSGSQQHAALHVALAGASGWIWSEAGQIAEGLDHCECAVLRLDSNIPPLHAARMLARWALIRSMCGALELPSVERAAELFRRSGDSRGLYTTAALAVGIAAKSGHADESEQWLLEAQRAHDPAWPIASRWHLLSARVELAYSERRFADAEIGANECLLLVELTGDRKLTRATLANLASLAAARGDLVQAISRGRALLEMQKTSRNAPFDWIAMAALANYGCALTESSLIDQALPVLREVAQLLRRQKKCWMLLDAVSLLAAKRGLMREAALVLGCSQACRTEQNVAREDRSDQRIFATISALLASTFSADELEHLFAQGAAMTDEDVACLALLD